MAKNATILLVDDEVNLQRTLALILERAGYAVVIASSAQDTLKIIQCQRIDLMFLDINMPGKTGLELLPEIMDHIPNIPIVMLTAHPSQETWNTAMALGACGYLVKPLDPVAIVKFARDYLNHY